MKIFISGIDTDSGKTYATSALAACLIKAKNATVITQKPVQTGCVGVADDLKLHRKMMHCEMVPADESHLTCRYLFDYPASPHLSARLAGAVIDPELIYADSEALDKQFDYTLIEGAGGLMVPLNEEMLTIDFIKKYNLPLILVCSGKLGSINHTLLSLEAIKNRNIDLVGVIYNDYPAVDKLLSKESEKIILKYLDIYGFTAPLVHLPFCADFDQVPTTEFSKLLEVLQ